MSLVIWKYKLEATPRQTVQFPGLVRVLSAQVQDGDLVVWALVDPEGSLEGRTILILGTGHPTTEKLGTYVGTVQQNNGQFVWHVFVV